MELAQARWLATHDGVISSKESARLGATVAMRRTQVESGRWRQVHRGVFVATSAAGGPRTELRVALALAGTDAVASHRSAAWLWGLVDQPPARAHVTVPRSRRIHIDDIVCHRTTRVPERRHHTGIPVTDPIRTLIDVAATGTAMTPLVDRALALGLVTVPRLERATRPQADDLARGRASLRAELLKRGHWGAPHPSVLESHMVRLFGSLRGSDGLPLPEAEVAWEGGRYRLDFAWPGRQLAVEVDGYVWHAGAEQLDRDHARRAALTAAGWTILTFTWRQVVDDPATVAGAIIRTYRRLASRSDGATGETAPVRAPEKIPEPKDHLSVRKC